MPWSASRAALEKPLAFISHDSRDKEEIARPSFELRERQWRQAFEADDGSWFCFVVEDEARELVGLPRGRRMMAASPGSLAIWTRSTYCVVVIVKAWSTPAVQRRAPHGITLVGRLFDDFLLGHVGTALEREFGVVGERPVGF